MNEKVTRFPITYSERRKNMVGPFCVECQVSGRYLRFHEKSDIVQAGEFITGHRRLSLFHTLSLYCNLLWKEEHYHQYPMLEQYLE